MLGQNYKRGEEADRVRDLIQAVLCASALVPEAVCVSHSRKGERVIFSAEVAREDQSKLLDANGPALRALRIIVDAMAQSLGMNFGLELDSDCLAGHSSIIEALPCSPKVSTIQTRGLSVTRPNSALLT